MDYNSNKGGDISLWRWPAFRRVWSADGLIDLGRQSSIVVIPLIGALTLDASPFQMGVLGASSAAPALLVSLIAGVWIDRLPRRGLMIVSAALRCLLVLSIPALWWADLLTVWLLAGIAFLAGAAGLFFDLARLSWLPALVGRHRLSDANGKMQASQSAAQMIGPSIGGAVAGASAPPIGMLVDAPASLVSAILMSKVPSDQPAIGASRVRESVWGQAIDGLKLCLRHPILRATIGASGLTGLFGHVFLSVYVLYMATTLELSSFEIGLVFGIGGFGALIGSFLASPLAVRFGTGRTITAGWLLFGLGGLPIPLAFMVPEYALALVIFSEFFQWMVLPIAEVNQLSLRQAVTPDRYLGRVAASHRFLVGGMVPLGALIGGTLGSFIGLPATLLIGVAGMLLAFLWIVVSPVRNVRELPNGDPDIATSAIPRAT
jgi:predicted MFS family arabinose efflux permease